MTDGLRAAATRIRSSPITSTPPFTSRTWPIAAAMLQFTDLTRTGGTTLEATPEEWRALLRPIADEGFDSVELSNKWLDLSRLSASRLAELRGVLVDLGLTAHGYLVASCSLVDPVRRVENLAYIHTALDAAADLGIPTVCIGLHSVPPRSAGGPLWFWTAPGATFGADPAEVPYLVSSLRELGEHAAARGVAVSLEMFPDTQVGTAESAALLIEEVGLPSVGLNPDLGNLVRVQGPIEEWEQVVARTLPLTNYWHVKNYSRAEVPEAGLVLTHPTDLEQGFIDYRTAMRYALSVGFTGTIVAEHYGGDGLGVSATNRSYLRRLLASALEEQ